MASELSSLASTAFNELTVRERGIRRLCARTLPVPSFPHPDERYQREELPLWRFVTQPGVPATAGGEVPDTTDDSPENGSQGRPRRALMDGRAPMYQTRERVCESRSLVAGRRPTVAAWPCFARPAFYWLIHC